ncbi:MAG: carbon-nitrogen hydrolase family protein [Rhizobiaceae bacterium]
MSKLSVLACQTEIPRTRTREERDQHVTKLAYRIDRFLIRQKADLVVLPELAAIEYSREAFENLHLLADPLDTSSCVSTLADLAKRHNVHIMFGAPRQEGSRYFISVIGLNPAGKILGHYDKIHICQYGASMEKEYFHSGQHLFVFEINGIKIAPIICYDIRFPELTRVLCEKYGTDLIVHCGAYAKDESFYSWHHFAVTRAMENQCHLISLNRAGKMFGSSVICAPWVDENRPPFIFGPNEEFRLVEIDKQDQVSIRSNYTFLDDKLDDYTALECQVR